LTSIKNLKNASFPHLIWKEMAWESSN